MCFSFRDNSGHSSFRTFIKISFRNLHPFQVQSRNYTILPYGYSLQLQCRELTLLQSTDEQLQAFYLTQTSPNT